MNSFLSYVAEDLLNKYPNNLARIAVVFPNKRAALFLNQEIAQRADAPIWSPTYITISELFRKQSLLTVADPIKSVCILHKVYMDITKKAEPLDQFYGWGELLLADFDDIDKNLAPAEKVFGLLSANKELESLDYLTPEQITELQKIFTNISVDEDSLRRRFHEFWSKLFDIYTEYKHRLRTLGLAYEGMLYRDVIEKNDLILPYEKYIFVGFNVLQKVEQQLFSTLKEAGKAAFYWDYDHYYLTTGREAGRYIHRWLEKFPNELPAHNPAIFNNLDREKEVSFIASPTENMQARYITQWLKENNRYKDGRKTAIVLCDESLLQTVIHCIPPEVDTLNVTTGYPLQQTLIASFVTQLIKLQVDGYSLTEQRFRLRYASRALRHPYAKYLWSNAEELLAQMNAEKQFYVSWEGIEYHPHNAQNMLSFVQWLADITKLVGINGRTEADPLFQESVFRMYTLFNRLIELMTVQEDGTHYLDHDIIIFQRLLPQLINATSVPFHGEPAQGVQVMGVLETRNIDFEHVLILSCNEGNMPKGVDDASFIPHTIRHAFELTTVNNKISIFSYYFHRILQRAKDITILYNNSTRGVRTGEMSRFMLQFMIEWTKPHRPIKRYTITAGQEQHNFTTDAIAKDEKIMKKLLHISKFSPTAINTFIACPVKFYYKYVVGIDAQDVVDEDSIDNRVFGNIFHKAAELMYHDIFHNEELTVATIGKILAKPDILNDVIEQAIASELFYKKDFQKGSKLNLNGLQLLNKEVVKKYLLQLLRLDQAVAPIKVMAHEFDVEDEIEVNIAGKLYKKRVGGRVDRLDMATYLLDDHTTIKQLRVVDYKTGRTEAKSIPDIPSIFSPDQLKNKSDYVMQSMLYSLLVAENKVTEQYGIDPTLFNPHHLPVAPALLFIQRANKKDYSPIICIDQQAVTDVDKYREEFMIGLASVLENLYDQTQPFIPTNNLDQCDYCPFKFMCGR